MSKRNVFGKSGCRIGQNVTAAIEGCDPETVIGIPPYNYGKMVSVMQVALKPDEFNLVCRGFGIDRPRQTQKEIAAEYGMTETQVSLKSREAIEKLKASPYRVQLRNLAPTAEQLFSNVTELRQEVAQLKQQLDKIEENRAQVQTLKDLLSKAGTRCQELEAKNTKLTEQLDRQRKQAETALEMANKQTRIKAEEAELEKARAEAVRSAFNNAIRVFETGCDDLIQGVQIQFTQEVAKATVESDSFDRLGLSDRALSALKRAGIKNLTELCRTPKRSLIKLGVGQDNVREIEEKLAQNGLSLPD